MNKNEERMQFLAMIKTVASYFETAKEQLCKPYSFSSVQATLLLDLFEHGRSKVTEICQRLGKSTNTISPLIRRLEKMEFIERVEGELDRRVVYIALSPKGTQAIEKYVNDAGMYSWPIFDKLSEEEFTNIYQSLKTMLRVLKEEGTI